ncbi:MAG: TolB family protein, partial [Chloroflexota bacterium]
MARSGYDTSVYYGSASYSEIIIRRVADGAGIDLIGNVDAPPSAPTWSPDGRTIVIDQFSMQGSHFVNGIEALDYAKMLASGQKEEIEHALTNDPSHSYNKPSFSPDGRFIACVRTAADGSHGDLWVMNADGSGGHAVAHAAHSARPAWSPDGSAIAFTRGSGVAIVSAGTGALLATIPNATGPAWGGQGDVRAVSSSNTGNPSPSPSPSPTPAVAKGSAAGTSAVTVTSAGLFRQVGGRYQATQLVNVGEDILYAVYYRTAGIDPSVVTGSLSFVYNGKAQGSFPLTAGKATDGTPVLTTHLTFPAT